MLKNYCSSICVITHTQMSKEGAFGRNPNQRRNNRPKGRLSWGTPRAANSSHLGAGKHMHPYQSTATKHFCETVSLGFSRTF
ncbi:unnamed protein product [Caenorhabditis angaria]|uniref:Uncharacterized protein n=1 Tax=Caenorhabditis angaria TaxID=860376 RepID=A0A9P1ISW9_9PELO|nr:unnamed protein product [Caenorhabditis angaria]